MKLVRAQDIVGGTIEEYVRVTANGDVLADGAYDRNATPTLIVRKGKRRYQVEVWRDDEGNGPGTLVVSEMKA